MKAGKNISLLLPSRERPALLKRLFDSIAATTAELASVEIILYIDEDDVETASVGHPSLSLVRVVKPRGKSMGQMNQICFEASQGRFIMLVNDDVIFRTNRWDSRVVEAFSHHPDEIALVYGNDLYQSSRLATMPILTRRVCELIGGVSPAEYWNIYIDLHLFDIFKKLAKMGHKRAKYLEDVVFEHAHYETGKSFRDRTYDKKNEQADDLLFITLDNERWKQATILHRYIEGGRDAALQGNAPMRQNEITDSKAVPGYRTLLKRWLYSLLAL